MTNLENKIKDLRNANIIHFFINSIIGTSHIIIYLKLFWITKQTSDIYYYLIIIIFSFGLIPMFLAVFVTFKKATKTLMVNLRLLLKYFIFLDFLLSILSSICLSENERELSILYYTCPFSYDINDIDKIFQYYDSENVVKIKENCINRRCFINGGSNDLDGIYLCNFNFKSKKKYCSDFNDIISNKLTNYTDICKVFVTFYKCKKPDKDYKKRINNYDYICPNRSDEILNIVLLYFFLIIDTCFLCSPWLINIYYIEKIIFFLSDGNNNNVNNRNQNNQSLNETNNTSEKQSDIEDDNNNSDNFERQPTQTIIVEKRENNDNNIINSNDKKDILNINQKNINTNNSNEKKSCPALGTQSLCC